MEYLNCLNLFLKLLFVFALEGTDKWCPQGLSSFTENLAMQLFGLVIQKAGNYKLLLLCGMALWLLAYLVIIIIIIIHVMYLLCFPGAICFTTLVIATIETALPVWMMKTMSASKWQLGIPDTPVLCLSSCSQHTHNYAVVQLGKWKINLSRKKIYL